MITIRQVTITTLLFILTNTLNAQDLKFGVTAGPNLSTASMKGDDVEQPKTVAGFQVGVFAEWSAAEKITLRPELLYNTTGYKYPSTEDEAGYRDKFDYLTLPIIAEYAVAEKLKVGLGPYLSAKLKAQWKLLDYPGDEFEDHWFEYTDVDSDEYKAVDYGVSAGLGYQALPKLGVYVRYNHGFSNFFKLTNTAGAKGYNRFVSLSVSYTIL